MRNSEPALLRNVVVDDTNIFTWTGCLYPVSILILYLPVQVACILYLPVQVACILYLPVQVSCILYLPVQVACILYLPVQDSAPYNKAAFRVQLDFPAEYPFKPPKVTFKTKIYHPNIDEHGQVCLPITLPDHWKPATKVEQGGM